MDAGPAGRFPTSALANIDPTVALAKLEELLTGVELAQAATGRGERLYCWICV